MFRSWSCGGIAYQMKWWRMNDAHDSNVQPVWCYTVTLRLFPKIWIRPWCKCDIGRKSGWFGFGRCDRRINATVWNGDFRIFSDRKMILFEKWILLGSSWSQQQSNADELRFSLYSRDLSLFSYKNLRWRIFKKSLFSIPERAQCGVNCQTKKF